MARKIRTLSQSAVIELQRMQNRITALEQTRGLNPVSVEAKAAYIVRTPSGGIPAATVGTTRVPGSASCVIYRRYRNTSNEDRIDTTNRSQLVYNLTDTDIPGLSYVLAWRDAWGDLFAIPGTSTCPDLLSPGSYPAIAGASIAAGATGSVVYDGTVYQAKNQSQCNVVIGDLLGLHVAPNCVAFFVPCVCSCSQTTPTTCCDKYIALCVNNRVVVLAVDGGSAQWTLTGCCECGSTPTLTITLSCTGETVTGSWTYTCGETTSNGTFDLSGLCDDPVEEYDDTITMSGCDVRIIATVDAEQCEECSPPSDPCADPDDCVETECCVELVPKTLSLTLVGGAFAGTYGMTWDGVSEWVIDGSPGFSARLTCLGGGNFWNLALETENYGEATAACDPFALTFDTSSPVWSAGSVSAAIS
jgi:hypothetical protein